MEREFWVCGVATVLGVGGALVEYCLKDPYGVVVGMTLAIVASFTALSMAREQAWERAG